MLIKLLNKIISWLFPPLCVHCRHEGDWLCPMARQQLSTEIILLDPLEINGVDLVIARGSYDNQILSRLIKRLKYNFWTGLQPVLADIINPLAKHIPATADTTIVPIPLHHRRFLNRGFNQSDLIAKALAETIRRPVKNLLTRHRYTDPQAQLKEQQRQKNMIGAFSTAAGITNWPESVILVDDVITTGSTIAECAAVLRQHGVRRIIAVALAKG